MDNCADSGTSRNKCNSLLRFPVGWKARAPDGEMRSLPEWRSRSTVTFDAAIEDEKIAKVAMARRLCGSLVLDDAQAMGLTSRLSKFGSLRGKARTSRCV